MEFDTATQSEEGNKKRIIIGFSLLLILLCIVIILVAQEKPKYFSGLFTSRFLASVTPTPTPIPKPMICKGEYSFVVMGEGKDPKITKGTLNPCDPEKEHMQFLTVTFSSSTPVVSADVSVTTDTQSKTYPMAKLEASNEWKASWRMEDTYNDIYEVAITGKTQTSERTTTLTFR